MLADVTFAIRQLRRAPVLALVAIVSLALGVGAAVTVFTWTEGFVLRPFPSVQEPGRLVTIQTGDGDGKVMTSSYPDVRDWREQTPSLAGVAAYGMYQFGLGAGDAAGAAGGEVEPVWGLFATANYFDVLGIRPLVGRTFRPDEERAPGGAPVVVIGEGLWERRFARDPGVVGRPVRLNGRELTVVGVVPSTFGGTYVGLRFELWVPIVMRPALSGESGAGRLAWRNTRWLEVFARLRDGATLDQTRAELAAVSARLARAYPESRDRPALAGPLSGGDAQEALRPLLVALLGLTGLVLLVVCANVTNLLLTRAVARRREVGVRAALGASRARLVRQMLTESLVLGTAGAALGLGVAAWGRGLFARLVPAGQLPLSADPSPDARVLAVAVGLALCTSLGFGLVPALRASRAGPAAAMRSGAARSGHARSRLLGALVVVQVAFSVTALVCAGLFLRALGEARRVDTGLRDPARVLLVATDFALTGDRPAEARLATLERLLERVRALPGVRAAALADFVPLGPSGSDTFDTRVDGYTPGPGESVAFMVNQVGAGYFDAMRLPIVRGRAIGAEDRAGAAPAVVVSEAFARRFWPGREAIGRRVCFVARCAAVVGVARDAKYRSTDLAGGAVPFVYLPYAQWGSAFVNVVVRAAGDPLALVPAVRGAFAATDPALPVLAPTTLESWASFSFFRQRLGARVVAALGALALALAALGLYGVIAYAVSRRAREIGVRMALGAERRRVVGEFVRGGARLAAAGLAAGVVLAWGAGRALEGLLFGVPGSDPLSFGAAAVTLGAVAAAASWVPARRAARVDPAVVLRGE